MFPENNFDHLIETGENTGERELGTSNFLKKPLKREQQTPKNYFL